MDGPAPLGAPGRIRRWWRCRPGQCLAAVVLGLVALFYAEENLRGKWAWDRCRRQVEAKGGSLDWLAYIPPAVPDELNVFKAPKMAEWFAGTDRSELGRGLRTLYEYSKPHHTNVLAEVTVVSPGGPPSSAPADLVLRYRFSALSPAADADDDADEPATPPALIPLIVMDEAPLTDAIKALARQAGLAYTIDPSVGLGKGQPQPTVSVRWEDVTAEQALQALLDNYGLRWIESSRRGAGRILRADPSAPKVRVAPGARERLAALVAGLWEQSPGPRPAVVEGAQGIPLLSAPLTVEHPLRVEVRSAGVPSTNEISEFFPKDALGGLIHATARLRVEPAGSNVFHVLLGPPAYYTAAEYLAWSDQFTNDFALMRQAFTRPMVRREGDYDPTFPFRTPNFVMMRHVSQALAQRAQCWLLLDRPEAALHELTLLHDLRRLLQPNTSGGYQSLVPAMINVAVTGLYVDVIADGLRLGVWREAQLSVLEHQLEQIDLPPLLVGALQKERAALCRTFEDLGAKGVVQSDLFNFEPPRELDYWQRLKRTSAALLAAAPRGWVYQNMALAAELHEHSIDVFDSGSRTVPPAKVHEVEHACERAFAHTSAYNFMAIIAVPNYSRAWRTLAKNQARAGQAQVACALERYRRARGDYPQTLDSLVPEFSAALPHDILNGSALHYRRVDRSTFVLYSRGWDQPDEPPANAAESNPTKPVPKAAWVWQQAQ